MDLRFKVNKVEYIIVTNPFTHGPMIARADGAEISNRKEICRIFLREYGWTEEMFSKRITNDLERQIKKILLESKVMVEVNGATKPVRVTQTKIENGMPRERKPRQTKQIDSVIVVRMYAGEYVTENIGHEIINTFKTDKGEHYIYVSPWGTVNEKYKASKNVLLVRGISADVWEVVGYATDLELLLSQDAFDNGRHRAIDLIDSERQLNLIAERGISYGGVPINKILSEQNNVVFATFKTNQYHSVKKEKPLYLVSKESEIKGDNYILLPNVNFGRQTLHMYMDEETKKDAYDRLIRLFNEKEWWSGDDCHKIDNLDEYVKSFNILDVIKRDEDELTFSNWLSYYLANDSKILYEFCKRFLNTKINPNKAIVKREYKNIDIWIEDDKQIVVIENKIKSGINGVEERHDFAGEQLKSQLSKYVHIASEEAKGRDTSFFILIPDYGVKDEELTTFKEYERYLPAKRYSELLEFLNSVDTDLPYYDDYKKAVKKHASKYKKNLYEIMEERFISKINSKK